MQEPITPIHPAISDCIRTEATPWPDDPRGKVLTREQMMMLEAVSGGTTVSVAAKVLGLHRSTFYYWLREDAAFLAAYNQWQEQMKANAVTRLLTLMNHAVDAILTAMEHGDGRLGLELLEKMGMVKGHAALPTDVAEIIHQKNLKKKKDELRREAETNDPGQEETTADDDSFPEPELEPKVG